MKHEHKTERGRKICDTKRRLGQRPTPRPAGWHHSEDSRALMSATRKGSVAWNKGTRGRMPVPWNKGKRGLQVAWNKGKKGIFHNPRKGLTGVFKHSEETKHKMSTAHKGKSLSVEHKQKLQTSRLARKARLGYLNSPSTRQKISKANTGMNHPFFGRHRSEETRQKIGDAQRGEKNFMWHRHHSEEAKTKISARHKGERNPNWQGGITTPERMRFLHKRRQLRKLGNGGSHTFEEWNELKRRYDWTCPACFRKEPTIKLTEDHILPIAKGGPDDIDNIQPLCQSCNSRKYLKVIKYEVAPKANVQ